MPFAFLISFAQGALVAWAASRFFVDARRSGELELLLTTPEGARTIVDLQWGRLKQILRSPVAVMLIPVLLQGVAVALMSRGYPLGWSRFLSCIHFVLSAVDTIFGVGALCWV